MSRVAMVKRMMHRPMLINPNCEVRRKIPSMMIPIRSAIGPRMPPVLVR